MQKFKERTDSWNQMMLCPDKTSKAFAKKKGLGFRDGLENFGTPILMTYVPLLLITLALSGKFDALYLSAVLFSIVATTLGVFVVSAILTVLVYGSATMLGEKTRLERLYYMISLAAAPTFVFTLVMNIASLLIQSMAGAAGFGMSSLRLLQLAGDLVALSVTVYGCYLMTVSIAALYKTTKAKALLTWLLPALILVAAGIAVFVTDLFGIFHFLFKTL